MDDPLISVVIPVYNTEKYVIQTIESVLNQTYKNIEIIIVDDGSTDNSASLIQKKYLNNKMIRLYQKRNGGASSARNMALNHVNGDYIVFLDSDDTLDTRAIEVLLNRIETEKSDMAVPCVFHEISTDGVKSTVSVFSAKKKSYSGKEFAIDYLIIKGAAWRSTSVMYNADVIRKHNIRYREGMIGEDFIFNLDYLKFTRKVSVVDFPTLNVQKRSESVTASAREELLDIFILLDKASLEYLEINGYGKVDSRKIADKLLIRNSVIYFTKIVKTRYKELGTKQAVQLVKDQFNKYKPILDAFKNSRNFSMNFTTRRKKWSAVIIMLLLKYRLYNLAGLLVTL